MPPWVPQVGQLLLGISALVLSVGFVTIVFKTAWAMRGWVEKEKTRGRINEELVHLVKEFIRAQTLANETQRLANSEQRRTNELFTTHITVMGNRLRKIEEEGNL